MKKLEKKDMMKIVGGIQSASGIACQYYCIIDEMGGPGIGCPTGQSCVPYDCPNQPGETGAHCV